MIKNVVRQQTHTYLFAKAKKPKALLILIKKASISCEATVVKPNKQINKERE